MSAIILKSLVLLAICVTLNGQRITIMMPTTTTSTLTVTTTEKTNCLKLNGVLPPCRKRRQFWVEEPIILMAPPEPLFIQPTNPFRVEPTTVPMDWLKDDQFYSGFNGGVYLHPSILTPANNYQHVNFLNLDNVYRNDLIQRQSTRTTKRTIMYTRTRTVTENEMTTKTNTIAISGCTPSPLPFDVCV
ncbi:hypothetical protein DAPPUDRAFT_302529 [Daphnia pulex]|uniref:Uncharacterized protein n=1 Tax=Daphnia pulex TaxID=6669 RepID=E9GDN3_DAPPU|nr:hypothetical protein DAPPUDRAFT_302529 [Daphnia pulex]|eukprot:EFX82110.1 hypothetical protein DAPPUDRAFT_302529 [Daphnia pulex]